MAPETELDRWALYVITAAFVIRKPLGLRACWSQAGRTRVSCWRRSSGAGRAEDERVSVCLGGGTPS